MHVGEHVPNRLKAADRVPELTPLGGVLAGEVEHRRRGPDDGLAHAMRTVDESVRASPQRPLAQILARLRQANPDDDTCILAARPVTGETRDLRHHLRTVS